MAEWDLNNDEVLKRIINFRDGSGEEMIKKFDIEYLIDYLDRSKI